MLIKQSDGRLVQVNNKPDAQESTKEDSAEPYSRLNIAADGGTLVQLPTVRAYTEMKLPETPLVSLGQMATTIASMVEDVGRVIGVSDPIPESADDDGSELGWEQSIAELLQEIGNLMVQQGWSTNDIQKAYSILEDNNKDTGLYRNDDIPDPNVPQF